jgi:aryl-phospho-beta-D-glucosidase BglC (GH1 family)
MLDWLVQEAEKRNIDILLNVHAVQNSQNGFDNSGRAMVGAPNCLRARVNVFP